MKYINTFESFRNQRSEPINEELLGGLINMFKNMWGKATQEIKKLGEKPTMGQIDKWVENNTFNRSSANYLFKSIITEFKKKSEASTEDCLKLVEDILDPETGALGKESLQPFYDSLLKIFGKNLLPLETIKYYFQTARDNAIRDYKYAGGTPENVDPKNKVSDINDDTHLPDLKKILLSAKDDDGKKKELTINWVERNLLVRLLKYIQEIQPEEVDKYLKSKNIDVSGSTDYKADDNVIYLLKDKTKDEWAKLTDEEKAKPLEAPANLIVGVHKIAKIDGNTLTLFDKYDKPTIVKTVDQIISKTIDNQSQEAKNAAVELGKIKGDSEKMKIVADVAKALSDENKKAEIEKIIGGE